jgi:hypothetical protein
MFGRKRATEEPLPWYRNKNYRGALRERDKRVLDSIRLQEKHPAATYASLPKEVQNYITRLECDVYDAKQSALFYSCAFVTFLGGLGIMNWWKESINYGNWDVITSIVLIVAPWLYWYKKEKQNSREFSPRNNAVGPTNEALKKEWEIKYISHCIRRESDEF